jgi:hypothetical protein
VERLNISFPDETRRQLEDLARLHGGNVSEAVRVAVAREWERQYQPGSTAPDALLERVDLLAMQIRSALQAEFEKRAG